jgi:hypothetical protein
MQAEKAIASLFHSLLLFLNNDRKKRGENGEIRKYTQLFFEDQRAEKARENANITISNPQQTPFPCHRKIWQDD